VDAAGKMPTGMGKVFKRISDTDKGPLTYKEARDIYSNVSRLTADDVTSLSKPIQRQMGSVREALKGDIGDTAGQVDKMEQYYAGLKEYAMAARMKAVKENIVNYDLKPGIKAAIGGAGLKFGYDTYEAAKK